MNLEMSTSSEAKNLAEMLIIDIEKNLHSKPAPDQCCIYKVPTKIRRVNEDAYTPRLISIGPLHHGRKELVDMEKKKRIYMKSFLERITTDKRDKILNFIENSEQSIRDSYAETSELGSIEYVFMILYDAIFIIEIFLKNNSLADRSDDIFLVIPSLKHTLESDLQLFENQVPFWIFEEIYKSAFSGKKIPTFKTLSLSFFGSYHRLYKLSPQVAVKHFTDWKRSSLLKSWPNPEASKGWIKDFPCAVKLHESGLEFKNVKRKCFLDIRFEKVKRQIPWFKVHELQIPHLKVFNGTERQLRNIIALEQCCYPKDTEVCNYVSLMDRLINTEKDVELLVGKGIISNRLGNNASLANMFNKICEYCHSTESYYFKISEDLEDHYNNYWNRTKAALKGIYFNHLWRGTATLAAVLLLLLTVIQAICSILQVI